MSPMKLARPLAPATRVRDRHPAAAVDAGEGFVEAGLGVEARRGDVEAAGRAAETVECDRTVDLRPPGNHRHGDVGAQVGRGAAAGNEPRADHRRAALEAAAQFAVALERERRAARTASPAQWCCRRCRARIRAARTACCSAAATSCRSGPSSPGREPAARAAGRRARRSDRPRSCRSTSAASRYGRSAR